MKKWVYEFFYRFPFVPIEWIFDDLSQFVEFLAKHGFQVTGLDFSPTAIKRARRRAEREGVDVNFVLDDLTNLQDVSGTFDLVTDFGALNDMNQKARDLYMQNVLPLTYPGSRYLMFCFDRMLPSDEVTRRFGEDFMIETLSKGPESWFPGRLDLYMMTRKSVEFR